MGASHSPEFKPEITNSPIYKGGLTAEMIRARFGLEDVVKLSSNENPLPPSPVIVGALKQALEQINRYPSMGDDGLREGLAAYIGRQTSADHFLTGNGGCDVLRIIAEGFLRDGDEAIICPPTFPVYELTIKRQGARAVYAPLNDDFSYNIGRILDSVTDQTRLVYLCSPNNPTGSILTQAELDELMARLPERIVVVSDEVYHHFNTAPAYADSFRYLDRNMIIVHSFSKVFGLAGLRLGYGIARPEIAGYLARARLPFHINHLTMVGGVTGLADRDHIEETVSLVLGEREKLDRGLGELSGVTHWPSQANFFLFQTPFEAAVVAERLQQKGSIVRELGGFYMPGYLRVSIGLPQENDRFLRDLTAVLSELG